MRIPNNNSYVYSEPLHSFYKTGFPDVAIHSDRIVTSMGFLARTWNFFVSIFSPHNSYKAVQVDMFKTDSPTKLNTYVWVPKDDYDDLQISIQRATARHLASSSTRTVTTRPRYDFSKPSAPPSRLPASTSTPASRGAPVTARPTAPAPAPRPAPLAAPITRRAFSDPTPILVPHTHDRVGASNMYRQFSRAIKASKGDTGSIKEVLKTNKETLLQLVRDLLPTLETTLSPSSPLLSTLKNPTLSPETKARALYDNYSVIQTAITSMKKQDQVFGELLSSAFVAYMDNIRHLPS